MTKWYSEYDSESGAWDWEDWLYAVNCGVQNAHRGLVQMSELVKEVVQDWMESPGMRELLAERGTRPKGGEEDYGNQTL